MAPWFRQPVCSICNREVTSKVKVMFVEGRTGVYHNNGSPSTDYVTLNRMGAHGQYCKIICKDCWDTRVEPLIPKPPAP